MTETQAVPIALKDVVSFLAHDAGWEFTGLHYDGLAPDGRPRRVICRHGMPESRWSNMAYYYTTMLELKKIAYAETENIVPVLIGVCKGGVLHYCDIAPDNP